MNFFNRIYLLIFFISIFCVSIDAIAEITCGDFVLSEEIENSLVVVAGFTELGNRTPVGNGIILKDGVIMVPECAHSMSVKIKNTIYKQAKFLHSNRERVFSLIHFPIPSLGLYHLLDTTEIKKGDSLYFITRLRSTTITLLPIDSIGIYNINNFSQIKTHFKDFAVSRTGYVINPIVTKENKIKGIVVSPFRIDSSFLYIPSKKIYELMQSDFETITLDSAGSIDEVKKKKSEAEALLFGVLYYAGMIIYYSAIPLTFISLIVIIIVIRLFLKKKKNKK